MTNQTFNVKLEQRVNKLSSLDYANIEPWMKVEVANKAQDQWVRRQLEGINQTRTGAESSARRIDDLQYILVNTPGTFTNQGLYWQSVVPQDYIEWCRLSAYAQDTCGNCCSRRLVIFPGNEADVDIYLADTNRKPDYDWATTFSTIMGSTFKIWTNNSFDIVDPVITYYRQPRRIVFAGATDPYTGTVAATDVTCEFPDNITELIIDEAASILSGDMDAQYQQQRLANSVEHNT